MSETIRSKPPKAPVVFTGVVAGVGIGGLFDGILFHQILQWHHMLTGTENYPMDSFANLEINTTCDGAFHAVTWIAVVVAFTLLWRLDRRYDLRWSSVLSGSLLLGWGGFNVVEGIVDHHLAGIHHVRDDLGGPLVWDLAFLTWGAIFVAGGSVLLQKKPSAAASGSDGASR